LNGAALAGRALSVVGLIALRALSEAGIRGRSHIQVALLDFTISTFTRQRREKTVAGGKRGTSAATG
jgi:hypothetical protein